MSNGSLVRGRLWVWGLLFVLGLGTVACGEDDEAKPDCPDAALCVDGGVVAGSSAGNTAGTTAAVTGAAGSTAGGSAAGTGAAGSTAGGSAAGTGAAAPGKPATDGTQFASCDPDTEMACGDGLQCYTADGATSVGYCTKTCTQDDDCTALGEQFSCSSLTQGVTIQFCRATCAGVEDDSCPAQMSCRQVVGGFRCLYDEKDIGSGAVAAWGKCELSGDCTGELVCYPNGTNTFGGATYAGACVPSCMTDEDCTDVPTTGNVTPTCGGAGNCILNCAPSVGMGGPGAPAPAADGGAPQCPDDMTCANLGAGRQRCMYVDTTGGI